MIKKDSIKIYIVILIILSFISLLIGRYKISITELFNLAIFKEENSQIYNLIFNIRMPRILLVIISGAALALSGMIFQSVFQNPLISPDVLGVSSGCSLGAAIGIVFFSASTLEIQIISFIFGIGAVFFSIMMSSKFKRNKVLALVLSGILTGALTSSFMMIIKYLADPTKELASIEFWLMGGFYNSNWAHVINVFIFVLISGVSLYLIRWKLKILTMGDEQAKLLGVNAKIYRTVAIILATLLVASVVSVAGLISWIGILAPHIVKSLVKDDISKTIPFTMVIGANVLLIADTISRTIIPAEIPISIVTSLVGAPFLVYLLNKKGSEIL